MEAQQKARACFVAAAISARRASSVRRAALFSTPLLPGYLVATKGADNSAEEIEGIIAIFDFRISISDLSDRTRTG